MASYPGSYEIKQILYPMLFNIQFLKELYLELYGTIDGEGMSGSEMYL